MSSARDGNSEGVAGAHPGPGTILQTLIAVNLALGVCSSLFLLGLPSDPEHAVVGRYSLERVLLISGILVSTIALAILTLTLALKRTWRKSLAERFFGGRGWARRYLPVAALLMLSLYITPLLFFPTRLEGLTADHYIRLAPYLLWPWALLASSALGSWYLGTRPRLHVDSRTAERIAVAGLFLVSFAARAPLSGYGLPYQSVWDEIVTYPRALELLSGRTILEAGSVPGYGRALLWRPPYLHHGGRADCRAVRDAQNRTSPQHQSVLFACRWGGYGVRGRPRLGSTPSVSQAPVRSDQQLDADSHLYRASPIHAGGRMGLHRRRADVCDLQP